VGEVILARELLEHGALGAKSHKNGDARTAKTKENKEKTDFQY